MNNMTPQMLSMHLTCGREQCKSIFLTVFHDLMLFQFME